VKRRVYETAFRIPGPGVLLKHLKSADEIAEAAGFGITTDRAAGKTAG
jgi:hypothetical protein